MDFNEKVAALRAAMEKEGADAFMVTTEDAYLAESACDYWRSLRWLTGYAGTLAYALVTRDKFAFFTDARYITTVRNQLKIDGAEIYDVTVVGAEHYLKWIAAELSGMKASGKKLVFGFDGRADHSQNAENRGCSAERWPVGRRCTARRHGSDRRRMGRPPVTNRYSTICSSTRAEGGGKKSPTCGRL